MHSSDFGACKKSAFLSFKCVMFDIFDAFDDISEKTTFLRLAVVAA